MDLLKKPLIELIEKEAAYPEKITFERFMELALYHSHAGYYESARQRTGRGGDFFTSPHASKAFGECVANFVAGASEVLGGDSTHIIEYGAGSGFLALDVLDALERRNKDIYDTLIYSIVEKSAASVESSKSLLSRHSEKIRWAGGTKAEDKIVRGDGAAIVISNEFVDSLPFHRAVFESEGLREIFVTHRDGLFLEVRGAPSTPELKRYLASYALSLEAGQELEINLRARDWLRLATNAFERGFVLTIDYGSLAPELFAPKRKNGTMRCFHRHTISEDPYTKIGEQDITCDVDFSNLIRAGEECGLDTVKYTSQGQFLVDWGILNIVEGRASDPAIGDAERQRDIAAMKTLFFPEFMGSRFKALVQSKNAGPASKDFYPASPLKLYFGETP